MIFKEIETCLHIPLHSFRQQIAIVLLCVSVAVASSQDGGTDNITSCSVPPVKLLQDTVLTCHFPEDLNVTKKAFFVYHYVNGVSSDFLLNCWWNEGALECMNSSNTEFNKVVNKSLKLTLRQVTSNNTGIYTCQVAGYEPRYLKTCDLQTRNDTKITCTVPSVKPLEDTVLTCHFPEDVSVSKKDFTVYHYPKDGSPDAVLDCWWVSDRLKCVNSSGVEYEVINSDLKLTFLRVTSNHTGTYSCHFDGYHIETCDFQVETGEARTISSTEAIKDKTTTLLDVQCLPAEKSKGRQLSCDPPVFTTSQDKINAAGKVDEPHITLAIVLGSLVSILLVAAGIIVLLAYKGRIGDLCPLFGQHNEEIDAEANYPILTAPGDNTVLGMTSKFLQHLLDNVKKMYPEILDTYHFVPPIYFNKTRYKTYSVADKYVYSPIIPDIKSAQDMSIVRHDMAMHHVLYCLHHMADQGQEQMFVLTQFNYDDYLNNPGTDFQQHGLPVPSGVVDEEDDVACVDFVIVHREHGVLVGVVKAVSDKVEDSDDGQQDEGGRIVTAVTEAVQQLQKANRVIRHVMSDQRHCPAVRHTLMLPNLTHASLRRAVARHNELVDRLRECLDVTATEDPTTQCLCLEDLSHLSTPYRVRSDVVNTLRDRWKWTCARVDDVVMTDDLYLTVIARFCGPATQSTLDIQDQPYLLPKTLAEAVSLTGDLYERWTLHPDMVEMLNEQRLFLVGSPSHNKMRMLALAGKLWLSQGHQVYILSDSTEPTDSFMSLLWNTFKTRGYSHDPSRGHLSVVQCDLNKKNEVEKTLEKLNLKEGSSPGVIVQDTVVKGIHFRSFCETLRRRCPDVYLWATSDTNKNVPEGWTVKTFIQTPTCPPAVVREVSNVAVTQVSPGGEGKPTCLPPTDGPPVKYFNHKKTGMSLRVPDCNECTKEVADFLIKHLFTENVIVSPAHDVSGTTIQTTSGDKSTTLNRASILQKKDVLVLFESDTGRMNQFLTGLKECGIAVSTLQYGNGKYQFLGQQDSVRAMAVGELRRYPVRSKVVVYVEKHRSPGDVSKKQLVISICTSQLIVIR